MLVITAHSFAGQRVFFVGARFALISARRDRLGRSPSREEEASAVAVIRAARLSMMLAGARSGSPSAPIDPGRVGEPAVARTCWRCRSTCSACGRGAAHGVVSSSPRSLVILRGSDGQTCLRGGDAARTRRTCVPLRTNQAFVF